jgi:Protein of unknown function (DUF1214)
MCRVLPLDSYDQKAKRNADGSMDIYFGPTAPEAWRQTGFLPLQEMTGSLTFDYMVPSNGSSRKLSDIQPLR